EQLTDAFVVGYFPFYMLAVAAVFRLRRREPELARPFRVPGYPLVPIVFLVGALVLIVGAVAAADQNALYALGVLAVGGPGREADGSGLPGFPAQHGHGALEAGAQLPATACR